MAERLFGQGVYWKEENGVTETFQEEYRVDPEDIDALRQVAARFALGKPLLEGELNQIHQIVNLGETDGVSPQLNSHYRLETRDSGRVEIFGNKGGKEAEIVPIKGKDNVYMVIRRAPIQAKHV
jgi:hypothetical protein